MSLLLGVDLVLEIRRKKLTVKFFECCSCWENKEFCLKMSVLILVYWEGERVINCIMFTSTCAKCCHMCKTSGHVGPYHSWDTHPSFCFFGERKCLAPILGLGEAVWDGTCVTTITITSGLFKSDLCHVFLLKDNEIPSWFHVFFFFLAILPTMRKHLKQPYA